MGQGDYAAASKKFEEYLDKNPRDAHAWNQLGVVKQSLGLYQEAYDIHLKSIEIDKEKFIYWYNLGIALFNLDKLEESQGAIETCRSLNPSYQKTYHILGQIALKMQKIEEAEKIFSEAVRAQPTDGVSLFHLGDICYRRQDYEKALQLFQQALTYEKNHLHALNQSGLITYSLGLYEQAKEFYQRALAVDPQNSSVWNNLGSVLYEQENFEQAATCFRNSLQNHPDNYLVLNFLGLSLNKLAKYQDALIVFRHAISIGPNNFEAWNNLGLCLYYMGKYEQAIESCQRAIELNPRSHTSYSNMGLAKDKLGLHEEAVQLFEKSLEINEKSPIVWNNLGLSYYQMRNYAEAIKKYEISLKLDGNSGNTWTNLGLAYQKSGKLKESLRCFQEAVGLKPENHIFWNHFAQALMEDSNYEEAIKNFARVLQLRPEYFEAHNFTGLALLRLERFEDALESFSRCLQLAPYYNVAKFNIQVTLQCITIQKEINELEAELVQNPYDALRHFKKAVKLMQLKRYAQALHSIDNCISYNPFVLQAYSRRSLILKQLGRTEEQVLTNFDATVQFFGYANKLLQSYMEACGGEQEPELSKLCAAWMHLHEKIQLSYVYFDISIDAIQKFSLAQKELLRIRLKIFLNTKLWQCLIRLYQSLEQRTQASSQEHKTLLEIFSPIFETLFIFYFILHDDAQMVDINSAIVLNFKPKMSSLKLDPGLRKLSGPNTSSEEQQLQQQCLSLEQPTLEFIEKQNLESCDFDQIMELITHDPCCIKIIVFIMQNKIFDRGLSILQDPIRIALSFNQDLVDFPKKEFIFRLEIYSLQQRFFDKEEIHLLVNRAHTFLDSFAKIQKFSDKDLRLYFRIKFAGEEGQDLGGLFREWLQILSREIFNENYGMFRLTEKGVKYFPNKDCFQVEDKPQMLSYYQFVGKILGKALWENQLMDIQFTKAFYKHLLGLPLTYHDLEDQDSVLYKNLKLMAENLMSDLGLEETWSVIEDSFGEKQVIDLVPNGRNIDVTEDDKLEFIQKKSYYHMAQCVQEQLESILEGFYKIIPAYSINMFKPDELELILSGSPEVDVEDLKKNTEYVNYEKDSQIIIWFWQLIESLTKEEKTLFLQFVTGSSRVPAEGFKALRGWNGAQIFNIHKVENTQNLPTANTCFNQLKLPDYKSYEILHDKFMMAIKEGKDGFGLC